MGGDKNGCGLHDTLKSLLSQEWFNELSWFFACWCKWPFCHRGLKSTVSRMNWWIELIFAYCYKFRKAKNCFNNIWTNNEVASFKYHTRIAITGITIKGRAL